MEYIIGAVTGIAVGFGLGRFLYHRFVAAREADARGRAEEILKQAREDADRVKKEASVRARDDMVTRREEFEREAEEARKEIREIENRISKREESFDRKEDDLARRERRASDQEKRLADRQASLEKRAAGLDDREAEITEKILEVSGLSREDAKALVFQRLEHELAEECSKLIAREVEQARDEADTRAREVVLTAIQRTATDHCSEATVSTVDVPNDEMKGRIIGR
ncbi:MAG: Rnase Y domain-containing protein [Planctomycetota bacterium]|nr:Rnase Y domain-containing protein [Planctomycetota bacterium]